MNDILTKEERETVECLRVLVDDYAEKWILDTGHWINEVEALLDIIDNLSKRGVKKYSQEELQAGFEAFCVSDKSFLIKADIGNYALPHIQNRWLGFLGCAGFLGALEEK